MQYLHNLNTNVYMKNIMFLMSFHQETVLPDKVNLYFLIAYFLLFLCDPSKTYFHQSSLLRIL